MKIRTGFVSNSSSSSFMAIVKSTEFTKLKKVLDPLCFALLEKLLVGKKKMEGIQYVVMHDYGSSEDEPSFSTLAKVLGDLKVEEKIDGLPDILKGIKNPNYNSISDIVFDGEGFNEWDLIEWMDEKMGEAMNALRELEKKNFAITHRLRC